MKRFITFGSILQFRNIVKNVQHQARYDGVDEDGEVIYNHKPLSTLEAVVSEKNTWNKCGSVLQQSCRTALQSRGEYR